MTLPRTGAGEWAASQASPWETVNLALRLLDAGACRFLIEDRDLTAPPGSCADGACYLVKATATGTWAGYDGKLAVAIGANASNGWQFITVAVEGMQLYVRDENLTIQYDGAAWASSGNGTAGTLDFDTDGTLAANSDSKIATQKATKTYVDAKVAGLSWKQAVRAATTTAGTLSSSFENGDTIDGVTLATGDRILIKNQSTASENGIYTVNASGAPTRATDADSGAELVNASVYVSEGTTQADTQWTCSTNAPITVGSTSIAFSQLASGGGGYSGGVQSTPVLAAAMTSRTTNGPATGSTESSTNKIMLVTLDFDASTAEYAQFMFPMPRSWNEGTITAQFIWSATNTGNVVWGIQGVAISDDDVFDAAFGTAQTVTDGVTATTDIMQSSFTSAVTIGGSPAEGDIVCFQVYRDASNGSDTCSVDAKLIGIRLNFTTNAADDS